MGRKRSFVVSSPSTDRSPSTPVKANDDSELDLSQSPAAKRAKRSGRLSSVGVVGSFGRSTPGTSGVRKRVRFCDEEEEEGVNEGFTPVLREGSGRGRKKRVGEIKPVTPFWERIARVKRERGGKGGEGGERIEGGSDGGGGDGGGVDESKVDVSMKVDGTKEEEVEMGGVVEEEETSVKKSKKKKGSSANKKKKRKSLTVGEVGMGMVMEEIFPDLPKPAVAAATDGGVGEEEKVSKAHNEAEEQMNREFTASCTTDAPPGSDQAQDPTPMELDSTPGLDFAIHEDNEADVKGAEEIKELIEEVFARPEFEYQAVEEESVVNGAGSIGESVTAVGSREESPATLTLAATDNTSNAPENDDITTIKSLLQTLDGKLSGLALESTVQGQQDKIKDLHKGLEEAYNGMVKLSGRLNRDEMRAAIRHEILFNGMKSIVGELGALRRQQETGMEYLGLQIQSPLVAAPRKKWEEKDKNQEGKKALESCLRTYLDDMGRATEREQVGEKGKLAVEYAGRVLGGL